MFIVFHDQYPYNIFGIKLKVLNMFFNYQPQHYILTGIL